MASPILIAAYLVAIVLANMTVAAFGPAVAPLNAVILIGLDLSARDALHLRWAGRPWRIGLLIAAGSALSYGLARALPGGLPPELVGRVALASIAAFTAAAVVDSVTFAALRDRSPLVRMNGSNIPAAAVDSIIFPLLAFPGPLNWGTVVLLFAAKVAGGAVWALLIARWSGARATAY